MSENFEEKFSKFRNFFNSRISDAPVNVEEICSHLRVRLVPYDGPSPGSLADMLKTKQRSTSKPDPGFYYGRHADGTPTIVWNTNVSEAYRPFYLAHELAQFFLPAAVQSRPSPVPHIEFFVLGPRVKVVCDSFAYKLLAPSGLLVRHTQSFPWSELPRKFGISASFLIGALVGGISRFCLALPLVEFPTTTTWIYPHIKLPITLKDYLASDAVMRELKEPPGKTYFDPNAVVRVIDNQGAFTFCDINSEWIINVLHNQGFIDAAAKCLTENFVGYADGLFGNMRFEQVIPNAETYETKQALPMSFFFWPFSLSDFIPNESFRALLLLAIEDSAGVIREAVRSGKSCLPFAGDMAFEPKQWLNSIERLLASAWVEETIETEKVTPFVLARTEDDLFLKRRPALGPPMPPPPPDPFPGDSL